MLRFADGTNAMSIERLSKAVTAAGYVMVPDEEPHVVTEVLALPAPTEPREVTAWRSVQSKLKPAAPSTTSWLRGALAGFGRGATA
jgi:hypothetical protein